MDAAAPKPPATKEEAFDLIIDMLADVMMRRRAATLGALGCRHEKLVKHILTTVANYYDVPIELMLSKRRSRPLVWPRQVAAYLIRKHTNLSFKEIGVALQTTNHTILHHSISRVEGTLATPHLEEAKQVKELMSKLVEC